MFAHLPTEDPDEASAQVVTANTAEMARTYNFGHTKKTAAFCVCCWLCIVGVGASAMLMQLYPMHLEKRQQPACLKPLRKSGGRRLTIEMEEDVEDDASPQSTSSHTSASNASRSVQPIVVDVCKAFEGVQSIGNRLQFNTGALFPEGYTKQSMPYAEHFQGIQRLRGSNYLVVSGSGSTEHTAHLFVVRMSSATNGGGALSSTEASGSPPDTDQVVRVERFDSEFDHAGGFSVWGSFLAVGAEQGCPVATRLVGGCRAKSRVHFFDVSDPENFTKLDYTLERSGATAGAVALMQEQDGRFLLLVGRTDSAILDFYRSSDTSLATDPGFAPVGTWRKESLTHEPSTDRHFGQYQTLNMVMQTDGQLFLVGFYRTMTGLGYDYADLFTLSVPPVAEGDIAIHKVASKLLTVTSKLSSSGDVNFYAGAGLYVASATSFAVYGVDWVPRRGVVAVNEFITGCMRDTGGKCSFWGCSSRLGSTECASGKCFCQPGYCSSPKGVCKASDR